MLRHTGSFPSLHVAPADDDADNLLGDFSDSDDAPHSSDANLVEPLVEQASSSAGCPLYVDRAIITTSAETANN